MHRIIATVLWAYFGWYLASFVLALVGAPAEAGIVGGLAMAGLAWVDLRGRFRRRSAATPVTIASAER
jgi:hypothetical protein